MRQRSTRPILDIARLLALTAMLWHALGPTIALAWSHAAGERFMVVCTTMAESMTLVDADGREIDRSERTFLSGTHCEDCACGGVPIVPGPSFRATAPVLQAIDLQPLRSDVIASPLPALGGAGPRAPPTSS